MPRPIGSTNKPKIETEDKAAVEALAQHDAEVTGTTVTGADDQMIETAVTEAVKDVQNTTIDPEVLRKAVDEAVRSALAGAPPEWTADDEAYWKACVAKGHLAEIDAKGNWIGEEQWPIFLGYPTGAACGYPVRRIGKQSHDEAGNPNYPAQCHCDVYIRTDVPRGIA